jgi:hypothetical protein
MSDEANDNATLGRGDFFAVDRRTWAMAFDTAGLHAALAYLVTARGSLADMRTTSWSAESVNHRTRLNWRQAKEAISKLIAAGFTTEQQIATPNGRDRPIADIRRGIAWGHAVWQKSATIAKANGSRAQKRRSPSR